MKFFGQEFEMNLPSFLPTWANDRIIKSFNNELLTIWKAENFSDVKKVIDVYTKDVKRAAIKERIAFYQVRVSKGKTELSIMVKIDCEQIKANEIKTSTSSFSAPKSMLVTIQNKHFLPSFFVHSALLDVKNRSRYKSQQNERSPITPANFPDTFQEELKNEILSKLPSQKFFDQLSAVSIKVDKAKREEQNLESQKIAEENAKERQERALEAEAAKKKVEQRFAKLETISNVSIDFVVYDRVGNGFKKRIVRAENATVKYSRSRAYIFLNGKEKPITITAKNVTILSQNGEQVTA